MRWLLVFALVGCGRIDFDPTNQLERRLEPYEFGNCYTRGPGDILCWGANQYGQAVEGTASPPLIFPTQAPPIADAIDYARGEDSTCVLHETGTVDCWGNNDVGQLGVGGGTRVTRSPVPGVSGIVRLDSIDFTVYARRADGSYIGWGKNEDGALCDGTIVDRAVATPLPLLDGAIRVVGDQYHACSLWDDGALYCWGRNAFGTIGVDTTDPFYAAPQRVIGSEGALDVAVGIFHTCAIFADQQVHCWGWNMYGQLGVEGVGEAHAPVEVPGTEGAERIVAGEEFTCFVRAGELRCWGTLGPFVLGTTPIAIEGADHVGAVGAGITHVCFTRDDDGGVYCLGGGGSGQLGDGTIDRLAAGPVTIMPAGD